MLGRWEIYFLFDPNQPFDVSGCEWSEGTIQDYWVCFDEESEAFNGVYKLKYSLHTSFLLGRRTNLKKPQKPRKMVLFVRRD